MVGWSRGTILPPSRWGKPLSGGRLTGQVALAVQNKTVLPTLAGAAMAPPGRHERWRRLLPARLMVYGGLTRCLRCDTREREALAPDVYKKSFLGRMNLTATPDA